MGLIRILLLLAAMLPWGPALGGDGSDVEVIDPYLELHTGPGRGYPVFHIAERGEHVRILKRRTDWFLVRTADGREGWVPLAQIAATAGESGPPPVAGPGREEFAGRRWEAGVLGGDLEGGRATTLHLGYYLTPGLIAEVSATQSLGQFSTHYLAGLDLVSQPFPDWRFSPYFAVGAGVIRTDPRATLVRAPDRTDGSARVAVGLRTWLGRRFVLRLDYRDHLVFTSRDDNQELQQWQAGIAFFF